ncbi:MAG: ABC transporter substrate binding protein [Bdellovibrionota bacterium]
MKQGHRTYKNFSRIGMILVGILFLSGSSHARSSVVVLQGSDSNVSRLFFSGISSHTTEKITAFRYQGQDIDAIAKAIEEYKPDLIITIGEMPVDLISSHTKLSRLPFIVLNHHSQKLQSNAKMVLLEERMPLVEEISLLKLLFPDSKSIGTMYDPKFSQESFNQFVDTATKQGLKIASIKVDSHKDVASYAPFFKGKIDCFYFLPDFTTANPTAIEKIYETMNQYNIPVISSQYSHLESGALFSLSLDPFRIGEQAWDIAQEILENKTIKQNRIFLSPSNMVLRFSMEKKTQLNVDKKRFEEMIELTTNRGYKVVLEPLQAQGSKNLSR